MRNLSLVGIGSQQDPPQVYPAEIPQNPMKLHLLHTVEDKHGPLPVNTCHIMLDFKMCEKEMCARKGVHLLPVSTNMARAYKDFNWSLCLAAQKWKKVVELLLSSCDAPKTQLFP